MTLEIISSISFAIVILTVLVSICIMFIAYMHDEGHLTGIIIAYTLSIFLFIAVASDCIGGIIKVFRRG